MGYRYLQHERKQLKQPMGQKLNKVPEKEGVSTNASNGGEQSEPGEQGSGSSSGGTGSYRKTEGLGVSSSLASKQGGDELTATPALTDTLSEGPMSTSLGEEQSPLTAGGGNEGGDREGRAVTYDIEKPESVLNSERSTQHSEPKTQNKAAGSRKRANTMDGQVRSKSLAGGWHSDSDTEDTKDMSNTEDLVISEATEEDFVLLEKDESCSSSDVRSTISKIRDKEKEMKPLSVNRIVKEDTTSAAVVDKPQDPTTSPTDPKRNVSSAVDDQRLSEDRLQRSSGKKHQDSSKKTSQKASPLGDETSKTQSLQQVTQDEDTSSTVNTSCVLSGNGRSGCDAHTRCSHTECSERADPHLAEPAGIVCRPKKAERTEAVKAMTENEAGKTATCELKTGIQGKEPALLSVESTHANYKPNDIYNKSPEDKDCTHEDLVLLNIEEELDEKTEALTMLNTKTKPDKRSETTDPVKSGSQTEKERKATATDEHPQVKDVQRRKVKRDCVTDHRIEACESNRCEPEVLRASSACVPRHLDTPNPPQPPPRPKAKGTDKSGKSIQQFDNVESPCGNVSLQQQTETSIGKAKEVSPSTDTCTSITKYQHLAAEQSQSKTEAVLHDAKEELAGSCFSVKVEKEPVLQNAVISTSPIQILSVTENAKTSLSDETVNLTAGRETNIQSAASMSKKQVKVNVLSCSVPKMPQLITASSSCSLEQCNVIPLPPLSVPTLEDSDGQRQVVSMQMESQPVCYIAVITPPPIIHILPEREMESTLPTQQNNSMDFTQTEDKATSGASIDPYVAGERLKPKGPPPPVPKKPPNPFVKIPAAKTCCLDEQKICDDYYHKEEEKKKKKKRRHSHQVNKENACDTAPQDMCVLWDNTGAAYTVPSNMYTPDNFDFSQRQRTPTREEKYRNIIDFDAWAQMVKRAAEEEEPKQLDMLDGQPFLEKQAKFKGPPPPVPKKPQKPFVPLETVSISEDITCPSEDEEIRELEQALCKRMECDEEDDPEPHADTVSTDVRWKNFDHSDRRIHSGLVEPRYRDTVSEHETETYRPVAELIKETNRMHQRIKHADWTKPLAAKSMIRHADRAKLLTAMSIAGAVDQGQSLKVSQMKKAFDVTKKSAEKPPEPELKKG
ncbi:uncharacterized protein LOC129818264 [Salvelinus fontinalis]|uniref:uncharacterized protein LOC129818264 n=1 Tax=Salvelinus fontinalis TaxID=8038 RepID=UPI002486A3CD|nr:uncharacterized protein LOC129818264 [Salvelinus fontinalis]